MKHPIFHWLLYAFLRPLAILMMVLAQDVTSSLPAGGTAQQPAIRVAYLYHGNIWLLDQPSGSRTRLTANGHDSAPAWTTNGRDLLFQRQIGAQVETLRWQPGHGIRTLRNGLWSPDGTAVAFVRTASCAGSTTSVWVARGGRTVRITPLQRGFRWCPLAWSPNSRRLALARFTIPPGTTPDQAIPSGAASLWLTASAGGATHLTRLSLPSAFRGQPGWPDLAFWSPDGRFLTVGIGPNEACDSCRADGRPYTAIPVAGGKVIRLGTALDPDEAISWAPGGSYVVLSSPAGRETYEHKHLTRVNPTSGTRRALTNNVDWADVEPAVSPDGKQIAFARGQAGISAKLTPVQLIASRRLYLIGTGGAHPHRLTDTPGWTDEAPVWSPDGQWLLFVRWRRQRQTQAAEVSLWAVRADGTAARRLAPLDLPPGFLNGFGYYGAFDWKDLFAIAPA